MAVGMATSSRCNTTGDSGMAAILWSAFNRASNSAQCGGVRTTSVHEEMGICCSENATVDVLFLVERRLTGGGEVVSGEEESGEEVEASNCEQLDCDCPADCNV